MVDFCFSFFFLFSYSEMIGRVLFFPFGTEGQAVVCRLCGTFFVRVEDCLRVTDRSVWVFKLLVVNLQYTYDASFELSCRCNIPVGDDEGSLLHIRWFRIVPLPADYFRLPGMMPMVFSRNTAVFVCRDVFCRRVLAFDVDEAIVTGSSVIIDSLIVYNVKRSESSRNIFCICGVYIGIEAGCGVVRLLQYVRVLRVGARISVPLGYVPGQLNIDQEIISSESEEENDHSASGSDSGLE